MTDLDILVNFSRKYGSNSEFVLAGGGNTSFKTDEYLYIKGSGTSLSVIEKNQFVKMDRTSLSKIWEKSYSEDTDVREAQVLQDLMDSRCEGEEAKRPSVETLFHDLFSQKYVLHVHPAAVNGLTCSKDGKKVVSELFPEAVWLDACEPGYIMASAFRKAILKYEKEKSKKAYLVFHQNHGVFFAADSEEALDKLVGDVMGAIDERLKIKPDFSEVEINSDEAAKVSPVLRMLYSECGESKVIFEANRQILEFAESSDNFASVKRPLTPDHIVYCKAEPLYLESTDTEYIIKTFNDFKAEHNYLPKIAMVKGVGMYASGNTLSEAKTAAKLWRDAMTIVVYAKNFGGVQPMTSDLADFIIGWEVEKYRTKVGIKGVSDKTLSTKIAIVTGSAQGFGEGIARYLASQGAAVVIADINAEGALKTARSIAEETNSDTLAVTVNIADEDSVANMVKETVLAFGGIDIFVNNAGIVRAGSLDEMTKANFELVTSINYTAYFMCTKYVSAVMKLQRAASPSYMADIIEINSKSGLSGSNKNFAYAGSKFGGLGLTQSFALELAPYGIKVNAICPGNFLDGPLWSDPEKGLFVQYLNAGKVPGAKTVADVKAYYESKVPLGRGCLPEDVNAAVSYIIAQKYETGQALPVTGGQEMLN